MQRFKYSIGLDHYGRPRSGWRTLVVVGMGTKGSRAKLFTDAVIQRDGGRCWICGHGGARQKDEIVPQTEGGNPFDMDNCRAAHGSARGRGRAPCPVCTAAWGGKPCYCNQLRQAMSVERCRRIIAERAIAATGRVPRGLIGWDTDSTPRAPGRVW